MSFRAIDGAIKTDRIVHRVERVPGWPSSHEGPQWRSLCGVRVGEARGGRPFEFEVAVALDPEAWRLAANCPACLDVTNRRQLATLL